jgi:hypothetical protein
MKYLISPFLVLILGFSFTTKVHAESAYEEETYEDLVKRLNQKRNQVSQRTQSTLDGSPLDDLTLHGGIGVVASNFFWHQGNQERSFSMSGFQLSGGVDLFTENLVAEGAIRNFGTITAGTETDTFRELDIKAMYRQRARGQELGYRGGMGLGTRYFSVRNGSYGIDEVNPALLIFGAIESSISRFAGLGVELGYRSVIASHAADQSSLDLTLRMDGFF